MWGLLPPDRGPSVEAPPIYNGVKLLSWQGYLYHPQRGEGRGVGGMRTSALSLLAQVKTIVLPSQPAPKQLF